MHVRGRWSIGACEGEVVHWCVRGRWSISACEGEVVHWCM